MEETKNNNEEILTTDMGISSNPMPVSNPEPLIVPGIIPTTEVKPIEEVVTQEVTSISEQTTFPEVGPIPVVMPTEEVISQEAVPVPVVPTEEVTSQEVVPTPVVAEAAPEISQQTAFPEVAPVVMPTEEVISQEVLPTPVVTEAAPEASQTTAFPEVAPAPVVMPTAEVTSQEVVPTPEVTPTPVMPTEEINQSPQTTPEPEKKSSVLKVILMILLILAIMSGGYYVYKEYFAKPVDKDDAQVLEKGDNKDQEKEVVPEQLNGIYKKDDGEDQILLFQNSEKEGSLIFAEEVDVAGVKSLSYPIQLKSLEINANTMLYKEETNEILKIEKTDNKVVVTYLGKEDNKEKYENIIGSYTKTKEATSYSVEEFKK